MSFVRLIHTLLTNRTLGTGVAVFGWSFTVKKADPPATRFVIDGKTVQTTVATNNGSNEYLLPFLAYDVDPGTHLLEIDVLNATENYPFVFDYILYVPTAGTTPTASQSMITTSLPAASGTLSGGSGSSGSSGAPVGAIVGGAVGGVAVLVAALVGVWFLCFRRRRSSQPYIYASTAKPADLLDGG